MRIRDAIAEKWFAPCKLACKADVYLSDGSLHSIGTDQHGHGG